MLAVAWLVGGFAAPAWSETRSCRQLEADLASASGASPQARRYDGAIQTQREQLQIAYGRSRNAGCGFSVSGSGIAQCGRINAQIEKMERNLETLQRKRARLADSASEATRARIADALIAKGCNDEAVAEARPQEDTVEGGRLFDQVFGPEGQPELYDGVPAPADDEETQSSGQSNIYRIMPPQEGSPVEQNVFSFPPPIRQVEAVCVRICDGYLYPMSGGNGFADPSSDQKSCESSCPGAAVEVYYREEAGDDPQGLMSAASGASYSELPTAYLFKKTGMPLPPNCSCNPPKSFKVMSTPSRAADPPADDATTAAEGEPEVKSQSGSILVIAPLPAKPAPSAAEPAAPNGDGNDAQGADRKVRVVGPVFLPDPSEAIDLQAPVPHPVR